MLKTFHMGAAVSRAAARLQRATPTAAPPSAFPPPPAVARPPAAPVAVAEAQQAVAIESTLSQATITSEEQRSYGSAPEGMQRRNETVGELTPLQLCAARRASGLCTRLARATCLTRPPPPPDLSRTQAPGALPCRRRSRQVAGVRNRVSFQGRRHVATECDRARRRLPRAQGRRWNRARHKAHARTRLDRFLHMSPGEIWCRHIGKTHDGWRTAGPCD